MPPSERAFTEHEPSRTLRRVQAPRPLSLALRPRLGPARRRSPRRRARSRPTNPSYDPPTPKPTSPSRSASPSAASAPTARASSTPPPTDALPAGILFVGPSDSSPRFPRSPRRRAHRRRLGRARAASHGKKQTLRDWLRKDFFAYHKALYENRPIYFPLSQREAQLRRLGEHPPLDRQHPPDSPRRSPPPDAPPARRRDRPISTPPAPAATRRSPPPPRSSTPRAKRLRDELADFIAAVDQCAERGAPPTDPTARPATPTRPSAWTSTTAS